VDLNRSSQIRVPTAEIASFLTSVIASYSCLYSDSSHISTLSFPPPLLPTTLLCSVVIPLLLSLSPHPSYIFLLFYCPLVDALSSAAFSSPAGDLEDKTSASSSMPFRSYSLSEDSHISLSSQRCLHLRYYSVI
jgi:hypothetical protein